MKLTEPAKVSIIIPAFNIGPYIAKCLESVVSQYYSKLEIIIIDDGSCDNTGEICDEFAGKDDRIQVIHQKNVGLSASRNRGIAASTGDYVVFIDGDDWIDADMIRRMVTVAADYDADLVCCGKYLEYEKRSIKETLVEKDTVVTGDEIVLRFKQGLMLDTVWNKLWKRVLFDDTLFPVGRVYEDIATVWKLVIKSKTVVILNDSYYHYLQRVGSVSHDFSLDNYSDWWKALNERYTFFDSNIDRNNYRECRDICLWECIDTAWIIWRHSLDYDNATLDRHSKLFESISGFSRNNKELVVKGKYPISKKVGVIFMSCNNAASRKICYYVNKVCSKAKHYLIINGEN